MGKYKPPMMRDRPSPAAEALSRESHPLSLLETTSVWTQHVCQQSLEDSGALLISGYRHLIYQAAGDPAIGAEELQQQAERKRGETAIPSLQQAAVRRRLAAVDFECASHFMYRPSHANA